MGEIISFNNTSLAYTILKELIKTGMRTSVLGFDSSFFSYELESITSLKVTSCDELEEIEKLFNLKNLYIENCSHTNCLKESKLEILNKLTSLEKLVIFSVDNIYELNIEQLTSLNELVVINNYNLSKIHGIEKLKNLKKVIICGNNVIKFDDVKKYIENTSDAKINILDVNMFHENFGVDFENLKTLETKLNCHFSNISFGEMLEFNKECFELSYHQMFEMYKKTLEILRSLNFSKNDDLYKAEKIYNYISNNVKYNYKILKEREKLYQEKDGIEVDDYIKRRMLVINSSYSAVMSKESVCDGYTNMMRLLLSICNIESKKVLCSMKSSLYIRPEHVILKFRVGDEWKYADPQKGDFFNLNVDEISQTHDLVSEEKTDNNKMYRK